jgi:hypothetical protein
MKHTVFQALTVLALAFAVVMTVRIIAARPVYGPDGKYQGSVFDYGKTQTYTDRNGRSAGSSIDRAFNFGRGR